MSYTIALTTNGKGWSITDTSSGEIVCGGPVNSNTAALFENGNFTIYTGSESVFSAPISSITNLTGATPSALFLDLLNSFLTQVIGSGITLTAGTGIGITNTGSDYTISNTGVVGLTAGTGIQVTHSGTSYIVTNTAPTIYSATPANSGTVQGFSNNSSTNVTFGPMAGNALYADSTCANNIIIGFDTMQYTDFGSYQENIIMGTDTCLQLPAYDALNVILGHNCVLNGGQTATNPQNGVNKSVIVGNRNFDLNVSTQTNDTMANCVTVGTSNYNWGGSTTTSNTFQSNVVIGNGNIGDTSLGAGAGYLTAIGNNNMTSAVTNPVSNLIHLGDSLNLGTGGQSYCLNVGWSNTLPDGATNTLHLDGTHFNTITGTGVQNITFSKAFANTTTAYDPLQLDATTGTIYANTSSRRFKDNITPLDDDEEYKNTADLAKLTPVTYTDKKTGAKSVGLIAEDVYDAGFKHIVTWAADEKKEGEKIIQGLAYDRLSVHILREMQKMRKEIDVLSARLPIGK